MQGNAIQIPIVPTQRANANTEKTKNSLKDSRLKHPKKACLSYININSVRNKLEALSEFACTQVEFFAIGKKNLIVPSQQHSLIIWVLGLTKVFDKCRGNFENIIVLCDFNMKPTNQEMTTFTSDNDFINIIKSNTCFKTSTRTCIDFILTNKPKSFQNIRVIETGVSDHHLLIFSFLKTSLIKMLPNELRYRK